ncbi:MAG: AI-2E family transporter [Saezia sp.]
MIKRGSLETGTFVLLLVAVSLAFGLVIYDFLGAIFWAVILALIFYPLHRWFLKLFNQRQNLASLASLSVCVLLAIIPVIVVISSLVKEIIFLLELLKDPLTGKINLAPYVDKIWAIVPDFVKEQIDSLLGVDNHGTLASLKEALEQGATKIASGTGKLLVSWGQNTFSWVVAFVVMLYLLFFMFRDGEVLAHQVTGYIPLSKEHRQTLFEKFATVVKATVKGNIVVAAVQGSLGGLAFYFFDVQGALLWAVLMTFLSLLPAVGASLVWGPVAIYFLAAGRVWEGVALIIYGAVVIGMVDNVLRPILVGKDTKLPDYVVLISTLGGMSLVGITGFVVGPLIAALFLSVWGLVDAEESSRKKIEEITARMKVKKRKVSTEKKKSASTPLGVEQGRVADLDKESAEKSAEKTS